MTTAPGTCAPLSTYRNERAYPFCPGCGHSRILDRLNEALVALGRPAREVVIVSDIGCSGLSDQYFVTDAFHGLHGRSITYATGIKLARPDLTVVVIMGDGGTGIGGAHLLAAARRNIGLTVLVLDNFNFGMTGGQHSSTTPDGSLTATTPTGNIERPLDLCATVGVNGAAYAARAMASDADLPERIAEAVACEGFALLDIWGPCTAHFASRNGVSSRALAATLERLGFETGVLFRRDRPEFSVMHGKPTTTIVARPAATTFAPRTPSIDTTFRMIVAGSAGAKVRSAARLAARAAVASGLWVTQRDDYPVTVQTGHCIASLVMSPERVDYSGVSCPDVLLVLSPEGAAKVGRELAAMGPSEHVLVAPGIALAPTRATVNELPAVRGGARDAALQSVAYALLERRIVDVSALLEVIDRRDPRRADGATRTIEAAHALVATRPTP